MKRNACHLLADAVLLQGKSMLYLISKAHIITLSALTYSFQPYSKNINKKFLPINVERNFLDKQFFM